MSYNIQFQIAAFLLLCMTGWLLMEKKAVRLYTQRTYILLFLTVAASICTDILSVVLIKGDAGLDRVITRGVCKLYLLSIVHVAYRLFRYALTESDKGRKRGKGLRLYISFLPMAVQAAVLLLCPVYAYCDGAAVYTYGICVEITYACSIIYLAVSLFYTLWYYKSMNKYACYSIWFLIGVWGLAAVVQMFHNELLIVSFAMGLAMIYMYINLENPQMYIDNESNAFNSYAYTEYLQKTMGSGKKIWVAAVKIEGIRFVNEKFGVYHERELLRLIVEFLSQTGSKGALVFRTGVSAFSIFYRGEASVEKAVRQIESRFERGFKIEDMNFNLECKTAYLTDSTLVNSVNELIDILHYFVEDGIQGKVV